MRTKKTGSDLELFVMGQISKTLRELAPEARERVVNWVSSQHWADEQKAPAVQPAVPALS